MESTLKVCSTSSVCETSTSPLTVRSLAVVLLPTSRSPSIVPPVNRRFSLAEPIKVAVISLAEKSPLASYWTREFPVPSLENDRLPALNTLLPLILKESFVATTTLIEPLPVVPLPPVA
mgnify:CR=1 FL=1